MIRTDGGKENVSPLQHADRIKSPLLLPHGARDDRVPMSRGRQMYHRKRALHKDVRWLEFCHDGHTLAQVENQRDFYEAVFELPGGTIGKGEPPLPPAATGAAARP